METENQFNKYRFLEEPCRNFCIFGATSIIDPKDGHEKMVLSNLVNRGTGNLIIVDVLTGEGEAIKLPGDEGAWALYNMDNENLLVGTCGRYGYVHCLELKSRKWLEPLKDKKERYVWNLAKGSDNKIYGGTWPGCVLLRYDPGKRTLENLGKVSEHAGNMYSRFVYGGAPGYIIVQCGCEVQHIVAYEIDTGEYISFGEIGDAVREVNEEFICLSNGDKLTFYSSGNLERLDSKPLLDKLKQKDGRLKYGMIHDLMLKDGRLAGVRGQEYFIFEKDSSRPVLKQIPTQAPATGIMTIIDGPEGEIWGATGLGQTIFRYNPENGEYWNSQVVCDNGGEVYGMRFAGKRLFMSAYCGGDHIVYDTTKPWNQIDNVNPVTLASVSPKLIRPTGRSIIGPDGNFWTGWSAAYGVYGGGLSKVDVNTLEMTSWYDPIPGQGIACIDSDEKYIYFTTNGQASGLQTKVEPFHLVAWDPEGRIVWKTQFQDGLDVKAVLAINGYVMAAVGDELRIFKGLTMDYVGAVKVDGLCTCLVEFNKNTAAAFCGDKLLLVKPGGMEKAVVTQLPWENIETAAVTSCGRLYFAYKTGLYEVTF